MAPKAKVEDIDTEKKTKEFAEGLVDDFREKVVVAFTPEKKSAKGRKKILTTLQTEKSEKEDEIKDLREKKKSAQEVVLSKVLEMASIDEIIHIKEGELTEIEHNMIEAKEKEDKSSKPATKQ